MKRCPECGYSTEDDSDFCPRCGRMLPNTPDVLISPGSPPPVQTSGRRSVNVTKLVAFMAAGAILLAVLVGFNDPFVNDTDFSDKEKTCTWSVPSIDSKVGSVVGFSVTYTVYGDEMKTANGSGIDRNGSDTNVSSHSEGVYAVKEYVVCGRTVGELGQKLWNEFSSKINSASHPECNTDRYFSDFLLGFVQASVQYETDSDQFGQEEYWLYPVETLFYGKGDCEDTSIMASAIYNVLTSVDGAKDYIKGGCVFLLPAHAMAGIKLSSSIVPVGAEEYFTKSVGGDTYYFCETTPESPGTHVYQNPKPVSPVSEPFPWYYTGSISTDYSGASVTGFAGYAASYV